MKINSVVIVLRQLKRLVVSSICSGCVDRRLCCPLVCPKFPRGEKNHGFIKRFHVRGLFLA